MKRFGYFELNFNAADSWVSRFSIGLPDCLCISCYKKQHQLYRFDVLILPDSSRTHSRMTYNIEPARVIKISPTNGRLIAHEKKQQYGYSPTTLPSLRLRHKSHRSDGLLSIFRLRLKYRFKPSNSARQHKPFDFRQLRVR